MEETAILVLGLVSVFCIGGVNGILLHQTISRWRKLKQRPDEERLGFSLAEQVSEMQKSMSARDHMLSVTSKHYQEMNKKIDALFDALGIDIVSDGAGTGEYKIVSIREDGLMEKSKEYMQLVNEATATIDSYHSKLESIFSRLNHNRKNP